MSLSDHKRQDRLLVERDGEKTEVYNWVNIRHVRQTVIRGMGHIEHFDEDPVIGAGDSPETPDAVTKWVADEVQYEHEFWLGDYDIEVVNVELPEVEVL